jgi:multicomponent Na+:H+ antiporter subunit F
MATFDYAVAVFLLLNLVGGLLRIVRGPTEADRMLAAQLFGTTGVAVLMVLADAAGVAAFRDVALVFAILAPVNAIVFVRTARRRPSDNEERST